MCRSIRTMISFTRLMKNNMNNYRKLNEDEIRLLQEHSCTADDWSNIEVAPNFKTDYVPEVSCGLLL